MAFLAFLLGMILAMWLLGAAADAATLTVAGFNLESGDSEPQVLAAQMARYPQVDLWGLVEVQDEAVLTEIVAALAASGQQYAYLMGTTGGADKLALLYRPQRFTIVRAGEIRLLDVRRFRDALATGLFDRLSQQNFWLLVNHLARTDAAARLTQARALNTWASVQSEPLVAVGDYNFDWRLSDGSFDPAMPEMTAEDRWRWVRPQPMRPTTCYRPEGILDFIFTAGAAQSWPVRSEVLLSPGGDCPDDEFRSDHRPVMAEFSLPETAAN